MRRLVVLILLCLLPLQVSWAAVADHCGHEPGKATQHFGHHDDEHKAFSGEFDLDKQPGKYDVGHDHCHMSGFLGLLNQVVADTSFTPLLPSLRSDEGIHPSPALVRPERPKWQTLA